ncbi:hypothetical protein [Spirosoma sp.]|uniref:hypothetical protein n=1 Tax=Spirosoma sp. TaxID=1899569 RepID=UPI003B3B8C03
MTASLRILNVLDWTVSTVRFFKSHLPVILGLGLVAAFGRAVQLNALGPISPISHTLLEIVIEGARIFLFFYTLGLTKAKNGVIRLSRLVVSKEGRMQNWRVAIRKLRDRWPALLANMVAFLIIALLINLFINHIAYETCLLIALKARQIISAQSSEWVLILFFKNLSVIPFTLIFNALFLLWLVNRLPRSVAFH